jgi:hypothetical protein
MKLKEARKLIGNNFIVVYVVGTDEPPKLRSNLSGEEVKEFVEKQKLSEYDYAVIQGKVTQNFKE